VSRFTHLILTAFNVRIAGAPGLDPQWLHHRFELFERFCYPSVRSQTNQDFTWIVLLDPDTPDPFRERIEALEKYPRFRPVFIPSLAGYRRPTLDHISADSTHVITTTLDNDDAIATGFVDRVQREFHDQDFELVNFLTGLRLDRKSGKLYRHHVPTNPFISLIERNDDPTTIRGCGAHNLLSSKFSQIRDVDTEPLWLQVLHDRNIAATGVWGCRRVAPTALEGTFAIELRAGGRKQSAALIALENVRRRIERSLIDRLGERRSTRLRKALRTAADALRKKKRPR
jgi:hypothetical protein